MGQGVHATHQHSSCWLLFLPNCAVAPWLVSPGQASASEQRGQNFPSGDRHVAVSTMSPGKPPPPGLALAFTSGGRQIPDPSGVFLLGPRPSQFLEPLAGARLLEAVRGHPQQALAHESLNSNIAATLQLARPARWSRQGSLCVLMGDVSPGDRKLIIAQTKAAWLKLF